MWIIFVVVGRFLVGYHLNGKTYNDSTWTHTASPQFRRRRQSYTWWRRKSHLQRAAWRHAIMWPLVLTGLGYWLYPVLTLSLLACMIPGLCIIVFHKMRFWLFMPVKAHHRDGHVEQHWVMRARTRRFVETVTLQRRVIGLATRDEKRKKTRAIDVPSELAGAVRAELDQPVTELKLLMRPNEGGDA